jgi:hypothetical protein
MESVMTVKDVINTEVGGWVNGFTATVKGSRSINCKNGKVMYVAKLSSGQDTIDAQSFDIDFAPYEGQTVEFGGKGMKREEYNGYPKLAIGKGAAIRAGGGGGAAPVAPQPLASFDQKAYLERLVSIRLECEQAAQALAAECDWFLEAGHVQAIASGFFISVTRKLGL